MDPVLFTEDTTMKERALTNAHITAYARFLREEERAPATIKKYLRDIRSFTTWLERRPATKELASRWKASLLEGGQSPATVNAKLSAVNGLFRFLGWEDCRVKFLKLQHRVFRNVSRELSKEDESIMRKLQQHGLYNDVNKQNEFGTKIVHLTNNLAATEGKYAQGYAVNAGALGMLTRFERDCLLGTVSGDGHEWGIATLPLLNMPVGTYFYDSVGDYNTIAGAATADMVRTRKEHYGFAVDIAFITAYNSEPTTLPSPILAFNISNTDATYAKPVVVVNTEDNPVNTKAVAAGT